MILYSEYETHGISIVSEPWIALNLSAFSHTTLWISGVDIKDIKFRLENFNNKINIDILISLKKNMRRIIKLTRRLKKWKK